MKQGTETLTHQTPTRQTQTHQTQKGRQGLELRSLNNRGSDRSWENFFQRLSPRRWWQNYQTAELLEKGYALLDKGQHVRASVIFMQAVERDENHTEALAGLGKSFVAQGGRRHLNKALIVYRRAVRSRPLHMGLHKELIRICHLLGRQDDLKEARWDLLVLRKMQTRPRDPAALNDTGQLLLKHQNLEEALRYFQRAVQLAPRKTESLRYLAETHHRWARTLEPESAKRQFHLEQALSYVEAASEIKVSAENTLLQAKVLDSLGKHEQMRPLLARLMHSNPSHPQVVILKHRLEKRLQAAANSEGASPADLTAAIFTSTPQGGPRRRHPRSGLRMQHHGQFAPAAMASSSVEAPLNVLSAAG